MASRSSAQNSAARVEPLPTARRPWRHTLENHSPFATPRLRSAFETLRGLELFARVSDGELLKFAALGFERRIEKGTAFLPGSGDPGCSDIPAPPHLGLVLEGQASLGWSQGGEELLLRALGPGDLLGEIEMFGSGIRKEEFATNLSVRNPRPAYEGGDRAVARALTTVRLLEWGREEVLETLRRWPDVALSLFGGMAQKQGDLQRRVTGLWHPRAPHRLARTLTALTEACAEACGKPPYDAEGRLVLRNPPTRTRLAELAGLARETVSRLLNAWERRGWIVVRRDGLRRGGTLVMDAFQLRRLAGAGKKDAP